MLAACSDSPTETPLAAPEIEAEAAAIPQLPLQVPDHARVGENAFRTLAGQVPAFAGFYFTQQDDVVVHLTDVRHVPAMRAAMKSMLTNMAAEPGNGRLEAVHIIFQTVDYSFDQLAEWREQIEEPLFALDGVVMLDLDERLNQLTVGVEAPSDQERVSELLNRYGIPAAAVRVEVTGTIVPTSTLSNPIRPLQGGLRISSAAGGCTFGFNAILGGQNVFLTNSHCSTRSWDLDYGRFYQPFSSSTYDVGYEYKDPNGKSCGFLSRNVCRHADVAAVLINPGISTGLGFIARTRFSAYGIGGIGSTEIDPSNPRFRIDSTDVYPELNEQVHKIGHETGWTTGTVTGTCIDTKVSYRSNSRLRCQYLANYGSANGDSGSPIFKPSGSSTVTLQGIHWARVTTGGDAVFSPWGGVQLDLGTMQVLPPQ